MELPIRVWSSTTATLTDSSEMGMSGWSNVWSNASMSKRVALDVTPPMLADMLTRLLERDGIEVVGDAGRVDVLLAIGPGDSDRSAEVTINVSDEGAAPARAVVGRGGRFDTVTISALSDLVALVAAD